MAKAYFKFAARVMEHLGAELISSDDVAIYELVKNGFDASLKAGGISTVTVQVEYRVEVAVIKAAQEAIRSGFMDRGNNTVKGAVMRYLREMKAPGGRNSLLDDKTLAQIEPLLPQAGSMEDYVRGLGAVNSIIVTDAGRGMSD